jgi:COP9 signalosome complex subunit 1
MSSIQLSLLSKFVSVLDPSHFGPHILTRRISQYQLLVERRSYAHITTYVFKAEAAVEAVYVSFEKKDAASSAAAAAAAQTLPPGSQAAAASKKNAEKEKVQTKLDYATGLARLSSANYERAASSLLKLGPIASLAEWNGTVSIN